MRFLPSALIPLCIALLASSACTPAPADDATATESEGKMGTLIGTDITDEPGGLGISQRTIGEGPSIVLSASELQVGEEKQAISHQPQVRSLDLVRSQLPILAGLPPKEGDRIRFATEDVLPFEISLAADVLGAEYMSVLLSAGFEGLPVSMLSSSSAYLYVLSPLPEGKAHVHASRFQWPEKALLVRLRADSIDILRASTGSTSAAPELLKELPAAASSAELSAALSKLCDASQRCNPLAINPGEESSAGQLQNLLAALGAQPAINSPTAPPLRALLLVGEPNQIALSLKKVRVGATSVNGRLPPEVIRKVVRESFGSFRGCYEAGLSRKSDLEGKAIIRFVIDREGNVPNAGLAPESTMPDEEVNLCLLRAFKQLKFPQPEGGIVTVTYPLAFAPE